jgi:hypothetical protein
MAEGNVAISASSDATNRSLSELIPLAESGGGKSSPGRSTGLGVGIVVACEGGTEHPGPWHAGRGIGCGASGIAAF